LGVVVLLVIVNVLLVIVDVLRVIVDVLLVIVDVLLVIINVLLDICDVLLVFVVVLIVVQGVVLVLQAEQKIKGLSAGANIFLYYRVIRIRYWDLGSVFSFRPGSGSVFDVCGSEMLPNAEMVTGATNFLLYKTEFFLRILIYIPVLTDPALDVPVTVTSSIDLRSREEVQTHSDPFQAGNVLRIRQTAKYMILYGFRSDK